MVSPIRFAVLVVLVDVGLVVVEGETLGVALIYLEEEVVGWIDRIVVTVGWRSVVVVDVVVGWSIEVDGWMFAVDVARDTPIVEQQLKKD